MIKHDTTYRSLWAWMWVFVIGVFAIFAAAFSANNAERIETLTQTEPIPYKTTYIEDPELEAGKTAVRTTGLAGSRVVTYKVTKKGSAEVSRVVVSNKVARAPRDEVIARGTMGVWRCHDTTSFDQNPYNDNYCRYSDGTGRYVPDSEARKLDPEYKPGQRGSRYYNSF